MERFRGRYTLHTYIVVLLLLSIPPIFYKKIFLPRILQENSGVLYLPAAGLLWINDGGHTSDLYLTALDGKLLQQHTLPLRNKDWEELTTDEAGNIYIGDFGNGANYRQDLCIYKLDKNWQLQDSIHFIFPDQYQFPPAAPQMRFDLEAMVWHDGLLHLFSKNKMENDGLCVHYTLQDSGSVQTARHVENLYLDDYIVSGACRKPGSDEILLLSYYYHHWLGIFPETDSRIYRFRLHNRRMVPHEKSYMTVPTWIASAQYEAITYCDDDTVIISAEGNPYLRPFFRFLKIN